MCDGRDRYRIFRPGDRLAPQGAVPGQLRSTAPHFEQKSASRSGLGPHRSHTRTTPSPWPSPARITASAWSVYRALSGS